MNSNENKTESEILPQVKKYRRALPRWGQIVVLLVVFVSGGIVGAMTTIRTINSRREYYRDHPEAFADDITSKLQYRLGLNEQQATKIHEIIDKRHASIEGYRIESEQAIFIEFEAVKNEVALELNEEQKKKWNFIVDLVRDRILPIPREKPVQ